MHCSSSKITFSDIENYYCGMKKVNIRINSKRPAGALIRDRVMRSTVKSYRFKRNLKDFNGLTMFDLIRLRQAEYSVIRDLQQLEIDLHNEQIK